MNKNDIVSYEIFSEVNLKWDQQPLAQGTISCNQVIALPYNIMEKTAGFRVRTHAF